MSKKKHPLDNEFDFYNNSDEKDDSVDDDVFTDEIFNIEIPKNPKLEDIANIALKAYKSHMCDIQHMEPKYRARNLEVAQLYLSIAKDSLSKKEEIKIKDGKLNLDKLKNGKNKDNDDDKDTRKGLLLELKETMKSSQ
jgi:hypothetical protein